jgi:hypothetical protein
LGVAAVVVSRYAADEGEVLDFQVVDERVVDKASRNAAERAALESAEGHLLRASLGEEIVREMRPLKDGTGAARVRRASQAKSCSSSTCVSGGFQLSAGRGGYACPVEAILTQ